MIYVRFLSLKAIVEWVKDSLQRSCWFNYVYKDNLYCLITSLGVNEASLVIVFRDIESHLEVILKYPSDRRLNFWNISDQIGSDCFLYFFVALGELNKFVNK